MAILLTLADFKGGKYSIPDVGGVYNVGGASAINNVQEAINTFEKQYIYKLLGVVLGDLIITYIANNYLPLNADYNKIINAFSSDDSNNMCGCNGIAQSLGLKEYLKACIFYEYVKNGLITSQPGVTKPESETASQQSPSSTMRFAENKFNDVLDTVEAIQWYCINNPVAFPAYNGQCIKVKAANIL